MKWRDRNSRLTQNGSGMAVLNMNPRHLRHQEALLEHIRLCGTVQLAEGPYGSGSGRS